MEVELEGGSGTALAHWDEDLFDKELMTGYKDPKGEYVLPVTIDLMELLGHKVLERLERKTELTQLLQESAKVIFLRQEAVHDIDLEHYQETDLMETIPHGLNAE